tara:strand:+ start:17786 stop:18046 length:261 start_codon:yes stop_codon:yes gene_type:complete
MDFYEIIKDIQMHVQQNMSLYNKHDQFKKDYSKLFKMLCDPSCDSDILNKFINLHRKVHNHTISSEEADAQFGEVAANKYVKPLVE